MRFWIILAALFVTQIAKAPLAPALELEDVRPIAEKSILFLRIQIVTDMGNDIESQATGFFISNEGHFITTLHSLIPPIKGDEEIHQRAVLAVVGGAQTSSRALRAELLDTDEANDLALLRLFDLPGGKIIPVTVCQKTPRGGVDLYGFGFPVGSGVGLTNLKGPFSNRGGKRGRWQVDLKSSHGMSGGPVYDTNGRVRGVIRSGSRRAPQVKWVIPIREATRWLKKYETPVSCGPARFVQTAGQPSGKCRPDVLVAKEQRVLIKRDNQRSAVFDDYSYITYRDPAFPRKASDPNLIFETRLRRCEPFRKDLRINKGDTFQFADPDFKYGLEYVRRCSGLLCPKFPIEIRVSRTPIGG